MIFTIALPNHKHAKPGKSVWQTIEAATKRRDYSTTLMGTQYLLWGIEANWDADTAPNPEGNWHDLLISADMICLEPFIDDIIAEEL